PSYRVQGAEVSVRAWIAPDGTLAYGEEEMEKAKEIDLRMRLDTGGGRWRVEVSSRPPDFLVGGETHRKFWEALEAVDDALVEEVEDELSKDLGGAFRAFLSSPGLMRRTIILRIDSDDNDLVLMTGQGGIHRGWLLFKVRFETEKGVVRVKDDGDDVELLAAELGESKQLKGKHRKRLTRHLTAWLIGLRDWQRRMALA
nr:hypothetical protein [Myxococcota bacterium]